MGATTVDLRSEVDRPGVLALWFAVLGAPLAWAGQLAVNYMLEEVLACAPANRPSGVLLGMDVRRWLIISSVGFGVIALSSLLVALRSWRRLQEGDESTGRRALWMAKAGIVNSAIFLVPIALGLASPIVLDVCRQA